LKPARPSRSDRCITDPLQAAYDLIDATAGDFEVIGACSVLQAIPEIRFALFLRSE